MSQLSLKEINRIALPAIVAGIAEPLISLADTAIIGHLGTAELAGVGIASSFFTLIVWVLAQTKSAVSAIVSQYLGKDRLSSIQALIPQSIVLNVLLGGIFLFFTNLFSTEVLQFYEAKGSVLSFAEEYFQIRSFGFPVTLATFCLFGVFRGLQNTSWAMKISLIGGAVNILLDLLLVYGIDGVIPSFGVEGAAMASLAAQVVMLLLAVYHLFSKTQFGLQLGNSIHPELIRLIKMSGDLFVRTIALNVAYVLATKFAASYGKEHVAAHTIAMNIWLFSAFFIDGYANAGNAIAGKLLGQGNNVGLFRLGKKLVKINLLISLLLCLVYLLGYKWTGGFFTENEEVVVLFNSVFWLVVVSQPINAIAFTLDGIFKGLGRTVLLRNVLILSTFIVFIPTIYVTDFIGWELTGVWVAFLLWMAGRGGGLVVAFLRDLKA